MPLLSWIAVVLASVTAVLAVLLVVWRHSLKGRMFRVAVGRLAVAHDLGDPRSRRFVERPTCVGCGRDGYTSDPRRYSSKLGYMVYGCPKCKAVWTADSHLAARMLKQ